MHVQLPSFVYMCSFTAYICRIFTPQVHADVATAAVRLHGPDAADAAAWLSLMLSPHVPVASEHTRRE